MPIPGNLFTTAMAVMPYTDVDKALATALSLDVPFWPQLPLLDYHEDMYVQASEHFPGIVLDLANRRLSFSLDKFTAEVEQTLAHFEDPAYFEISPAFSAVYQRFLKLDLADRPAIRGQLEGPISFGFNVLDQDQRPILFHDTVRPFLFEFLAKRLNAQLARLKQLNSNAFMFVDEPGLQFLWSALSGYSDQAARRDLEQFFAMVDRPRGVHLCGNPDWDFLLNLDLDVLSLDLYTNAERFAASGRAVVKFLERGGVLVWGIVPTGFEPFAKEDLASLETKLEQVWAVLLAQGLDRDLLLSHSLLSPATCCLVNPDGERTVEQAFAMIRQLSFRLREKYFL